MRRGRKFMEQLPHGLQPGGVHSIGTGAAQGGGVQQPGRGTAAAMEIGGEVQSLHGPHCSALPPGFRLAACEFMWAKAAPVKCRVSPESPTLNPPPMANTQQSQQMANAIRALAMDAVQQANSGHPGAPMGMADMAVALWSRHLKHNPTNPQWFDRDRFVLSNGHGSMLLYALLHLTGYDLPIGELKNFRQLHSKTPGHPEVGYTAGVETTTGPLGQGITNAVGFALAEKLLAAEFNRDGHDADKVAAAIEEAKKQTERPTLIVCKTHIGKGSPNRANTAKAHGEPLGAEEIALTREALGWASEPFVIPEDVYASWDCKANGQAFEAAWNERFAAYTAAFPELAAELTRRMNGALPANFAQVAVDTVVAAHTKGETVASRKASQLALEAFTAALPELLGGSADLTGSNLTNTKSTPNLRFDMQGNVVKTEAANGDKVGGRHINYGVREFGMAAIMNGVALHGGFIPYGGTFLTFSDYSRNAIRMAALMKQRVIHVFTHDSIGLGEDGPTHQSIEHVASLRLIPNLDVWRPGDTAETAVAWSVALSNRNKPTVLALSRQNLPYAPKRDLGDISRGAYVLSEPADVGIKKKPVAVIIATGSEVQLALKAQRLLADKKIGVRVVSMPSTTTFDREDAKYKSSVLPAGVPRVAVEMGVTDGWWKYGCAAVVGIDTYGESAPAPVLFKHFGFTEENVADAVLVAIGAARLKPAKKAR